MDITKVKDLKSKIKWPFSADARNILVIAGMVLIVVIKNLYYYSLMGVDTGFALSVAITSAVALLMFAVFKRKWIPSIIYLLISTLMVVDVNYFSFFNRSLSINALGAATLLGGVTNSIVEIFMPKTLLLLADAILFLGLSIALCKRLDEKVSTCKYCAFLNDFKTRLVLLIIFVLILGSLLLMAPKENSVGRSVLKQEFFSYHMRDFTGINAPEGEMVNVKDIAAVTGNYDNEKSGKDFGCGKDMNLIVIQVEAMQDFVINRTYNNQEITPYINSLIKEDSFYFDSYYQQTGSGNTSDAEFSTNNSIFGTMQSYTYKIFQDNYWRGLPVLLKEKGYSTYAFHAYQPDYWNREGAYPGQGFDEFYSEDDYDINEIIGMGLSDEEFFKQSLEMIEDIEEPFYAFMVTLSSHHPFRVKGDIELLKEDEDTLFGNYLQSMNYVDNCIKELIEGLEERGLRDNTIIAIYGDHLGMNPRTADVQKRMSEFMGWDYSYEDAMNIPLIIHVPGCGVNSTINVVGGQTDFLPTIAYLMGFETLDTLSFGHNLCTVKTNFVPLRSYLPQGSFVTGDIMFKMSKGGLTEDAEVVNIRTHEKLSPQGYSEYYLQSLQLLNTSDYYIENDILSKVYKEGISLETLISNVAQSGFYSSIEKQPVIVDAAVGEGITEGLYCLENLESLYEQGVRAFALNLIWTGDGHTVLMHGWEELKSYFTRADRINSYDTLLRAMRYNSIDGISLLAGSGLIEWAKEHEDAVFYISIDDESILGTGAELNKLYFVRTLKQLSPELLERIIFIAEDVSSLEKYNNEGMHNVIFYGKDYYLAENIFDIARRYDMYGVVLDEKNQEAAKSLEKEWKNEDYAIYLYTDDMEDVRYIKELEVSGVVIVKDSMI